MQVGLHGQPEIRGLPVSDPPEPLSVPLEDSVRLRAGGLEARTVSVLYVIMGRGKPLYHRAAGRVGEHTGRL